MTAGEKVVWAALYAQALTQVKMNHFVIGDAVNEAAKIATTQLHALRQYKNAPSGSVEAEARYMAIRVLE